MAAGAQNRGAEKLNLMMMMIFPPNALQIAVFVSCVFLCVWYSVFCVCVCVRMYRW